MFAEKFLLLLEALKSRFFDDVPPTVTSTRAAFPNPPHPLTWAVWSLPTFAVDQSAECRTVMQEGG